MVPKFCPTCRRPTRPGLSFCTNCNYFLGQASLVPPVATQTVAMKIELMLVFLIAAGVLVAVGVLLTAPAS